MQQPIELKPSPQGMAELARLSYAVAQEFAEQFGALVADKSPHVTGTNKGSIVIRSVDEQRQINIAAGGFDLPDGGSWLVATTSNYGAYLELGTSKMEAQPYFAPAFDETRRDWLSRGRL